MKALPSFLKIRLGLLVLPLGLLLGQTGVAAVAFSVTPSTVSNTYSGFITLSISGSPITNGETVMVQKYLDANTNGVIDAGDILGQQFQLTDGLASVFHDGATTVTNINVPGDTTVTNGTITAQLNFQTSDISQTLVGKYLYKLFSPSGHFTPLTNLFTITNSSYSQSFTGSVRSSGTNVPNAIVLLFPPPSSSGGGGSPQAGAVANNTGSYTIKAAPGAYSLVAFKTNYLADLSVAPNLVLSNGATFTTNLNLISAAQSISGRIYDANTSTIGLPGLLVPVMSTNNLIAVTFGDTNGNFTARVTANYWKIEKNEEALEVYGYLSTQNSTKVDTSTGSVSGVSIALPKATAIFYGSVKDNLNHPLAGVSFFANDNNGQYQTSAKTDANGNYVAGALGGESWSVGVDNQQNPSLANYIFSQGLYGVAMSSGQAVLQNFSGVLATNHITGWVKDNLGNPMTNIQVYASANINGVDYQTQANTDTSGNYSLSVANGDWSVSVCCGCSNCDNCLSTSFQCPNPVPVTIANNSGTAYFTAVPCSVVQITSTNLPPGQVGVYYDQFLQASSCNNSFTWSLNSGVLPGGLTLDSFGELNGTPTNSGTFNFNVHAVDGNFNSANQALSLVISNAPLQVTTTFVPSGTQGVFYSTSIGAIGGQTPYHWSLAPYSASLPPNLALATNGVLSGTPATNGPFSFYARVTDAAANFADSSSLSLTINPAPLLITNVSLPSGYVDIPYSARVGATGGQPPYYFYLDGGSAPLPSGLNLGSDGTISGTPTTAGTNNFIVDLQDAYFAFTNRILGIVIHPKPTLSSPTQPAGNRFQFLLNGLAGQNYTIQASTNLNFTNWLFLYVTNAPANSFIVIDPTATNKQRFYRVKVGP